MFGTGFRGRANVLFYVDRAVTSPDIETGPSFLRCSRPGVGANRSIVITAIMARKWHVP